MTLEEQFLTEVQAAYDRYAAAFSEEGGSPPYRLQDLQHSMGKLVGQVSEINWCVRNKREW